MRKADTEKQKFLKLCCEKDRKMLQGEIKMSYGDFDRLTYITDFLKFKSYNIEMWNKFAPQFQTVFERLSKFINDEDMCFGDAEREIGLHDIWLMEFLKNVPDEKLQKSLKTKMKKIYREDGMDFPE